MRKSTRHAKVAALDITEIENFNSTSN